MSKGIYTAASGGLLNARRLDVIANNLANVDTVGFKSQRLIQREQSFNDTLANTLSNVPADASEEFRYSPGVIHVETVTDFTPGPLKQTGNPLHIALSAANQFFIARTPEGDEFTRAGNLMLNGERFVVTADGHPIMGEGGPIQVPPGATPHIANNGAVSVDGEIIDRIRVVEFREPQELERADGSRFKRNERVAPVAVENPSIVGGMVELPNFNVVQAMVEMITVQRAFEAYTKTAKSYDEMSETSVRVARLNG